MKMKNTTLHLLTILGVTVLGLSLISWYLLANPAADFVELVPGLDNRPAFMSVASEAIQIGALFTAFAGMPSDIEGSWPRFRGAYYDNISTEQVRLADSWDDTGPPVLWSVELGEGHAGPVVANGRVYLLDYDEEARADILRCFSFGDER